MLKIARTIFLLLPLLCAAKTLHAQNDATTSSLQLTLREGATPPLSTPGCSGPTARTLKCRPVTLTLTNLGTEDVRIFYMSCPGPDIWFRWKGDEHPSPIPSDAPQPLSCDKAIPVNFVLKAGGKKDWPTRIGPLGITAPGTYLIRAIWHLDGCLAHDEACEAASQKMQWRKLADITSNEIPMTDRAPATPRAAVSAGR